MCGGQLKKNDDGTFTCLHCGTIQIMDTKATKSLPQSHHGSNKPSTRNQNSEEKDHEIKNGIYLKACNLAAKGDIDHMSQAVDLFAKIPGFRDADKRRTACEKSIQEQKKEIATKREREEKRLKREKRKRKIRRFFTITIILRLIFGIPLKNKLDHSIDRIEIKIVDMSSAYKSNVKYSVNGCYYIYFNYELTNHAGVTIDYIQFVTYVEDKTGKSIGQITTSFGGYGTSTMNLEKKDTVILESYLSENQPEANDFFSTLYDSNIEDWTFTYKITSVKFRDGENYFNT